jgi:hypothetical protein
MTASDSALVDMAGGDSALAARLRFAQAVRELLSLRALFERATGRERSLLYARCIEWLTEVRGLANPPLPTGEITTLTREVDWHLRSLAGLGTGSGGDPEAHAASALDGLEALARLGGPP